MISRNTLLFFVITLYLSTALHAQDLPSNIINTKPDLLAEAEILPDVAKQKKTHSEKIIFTQIKLAKDKPNLDAFAHASPRVEKAQEIDKNAMALAEYNRIGNSFNMHNEGAPIVVHTTLEVDEYSSLQNFIVFDEFDKTSFFQFRAYGHHVGIVPENAENYSKLQLSKIAAERFFRILGSNTEVTAEFILTPTYSDNQNPAVINDNNIWLMFTRVGEFRIWSQDSTPELLWYHRAPWYAPQDDTHIQDLYSKP